MEAPAHPASQLFLITMVVIKGNKLCNDQCVFNEVTVFLLFAAALIQMAARWLCLS